MSFRKILALLVLVAALGTYLYVYELPQAQKEGKKDKLVPLDKDAVTGISLVFPDRQIDLRKDDQGWQLVKPLTAPADDAAVKGLVNTIADAEVQKTIDEVPQDLASFGLDKPEPTVTLTLKDGSQTPPLAVGKNTTIGGKTYARKDDEPKIYLTGSTLHFGLAKQVKDLRDKQLLAFQDDDVSRVEIAPEDGPTTLLVRKDKDAWAIEPGDRPADSTEVRAHALLFQECGARSFVELQRPIVDERQAPANGVQVGNGSVLIVVELPHIREGAEGDVELTTGPLADLTRDAQDVLDVWTDRHGVVAGGGVQAVDVASRAPHAHERFEAIEFRENRVERGNGGRLGGGPGAQA